MSNDRARLPAALFLGYTNVVTIEFINKQNLFVVAPVRVVTVELLVRCNSML